MTIELRQIAAVRVARGPVILDQPVQTPTALYTGESDRYLVKFDKRTLKEVWRKKQMAWVRSAHGDNILVYAGQSDETQLWSGDGKVLWTRPGQTQAEGDRLYFNKAGWLHVVDVSTGKTVDEFECPPGSSRFFHDGVLLLADARGENDAIQAVDVGRRRVLWGESLASKILERYDDPCSRGLSFIATRPGYVIAKSGAHLVDVSLADGSLGWGLPLSVAHCPPLVHGGRMYIWSAPADWIRTRVTLDTTTGDVIRESIRPLAAENRLVIVGGSTGDVLVNQLLSVHGPTFAQFQEPYGGTIGRKHVLFTTTSGLMALFRLSDGELVWQHEYGDRLSSPLVDENRVYVASSAGDLILFEAEGGEL